ncbi:MAG: hydantoinase B/oxoprolinase family protein [Planctomycetota bacterium]|nr:hydantoinase B/oxoprolinase family protein [Planctomycetota bacterium]MDA1114325.1 hydantoinase B/oxoprolinase family protein [Planctomycetota bacterium]
MKRQSHAALHVFRHLFASVTDEMGFALRQSAVSPNIKERLDYSCALLDASGRLAAHAAFIPVHLGSAHHTVPEVLKDMDPQPGDVIVLNDPHRGGTHLNDVTVVAPLFHGKIRLGFLLNRAHHADIGGAEPGSMSGARDLFGEGLRIPPVHLRRAGKDVPEVWQIFQANVRDPYSAQADLLAQCAALHRGSLRFTDLVQRYGAKEITSAMADLFDYGSRFARKLLSDWPKQSVEVSDTLDGPGTPLIKLKLQIQKGKLHLDFTGSSAQIPGSWNTHRAVTTSAVFYVLQALGKGALPETSGTLNAVSIQLPSASLVDSQAPSGVALGNVETSQRLVDLLLQALGKLFPGQYPAASQGTMNNLLFGGTRADGTPFVHYETLAGGAGAGPHSHGVSAVQSHMTNTRNTPVEVLESELPLRVEQLSLRKNSGGRGKHRGGDGMIKAFTFLQPVRLTVAASRRHSKPPGSNGGQDGKLAFDSIAQPESPFRRLPPGESVLLEPGGRVRIQTPGGGGWGKPK